MSLALGALDVRQVRFAAPQTGAWLADCDIDLPSTQPTPSGPQILTIGSSHLKGTVIAEGTGRFGETVRVRMLAGGAGWGKLIDPSHIHNDAPPGVTSANVLSSIASAIGESVVDSSPESEGIDYVIAGDVRFGGLAQASSVLDGRQWYVDANGVTQVAPWPTLAMDPSADVLFLNVEERIATMSADEIVWPGTVISDARFSAMTIVEVDQTFTQDGSKVTAYLASSATDRIGNAFAAVAGAGEPMFDRIYWYRISSQGPDGRLRLQAMVKSAGVPDTLPLSVWPGMPGMSAKYTLGSLCAVYFLNGDRTQPRVFSFDGSNPLELDIDATTSITIGETAPAIKLGGPSALPVVLAEPLLIVLAAISAELAADVALLSNPPTSITFAAYAPAKLALLNTLVAAIAAQIALIPTVKVGAV